MLIESTVFTAYGFPITSRCYDSTVDRWSVNVSKLKELCLEKRTRGMICVPPFSHHAMVDTCLAKV